MGKVEISYFFWTSSRYLNFVFAEIFIEYISMFHVTFFLILYFDWLLGPHKQAAQCSLVQNIYFGLQKIGNLCPKIGEK